MSKKSDYDRMKTHCSDTISELEDEVQRLKSEKARLLDRLQLPESERASLAAEENEIAELKRRLDDYEIRYGDAVAENEDLQQEVQSTTSQCLESRIFVGKSGQLHRLDSMFSAFVFRESCCQSATTFSAEIR